MTPPPSTIKINLIKVVKSLYIILGYLEGDPHYNQCVKDNDGINIHLNLEVQNKVEIAGLPSAATG